MNLMLAGALLDWDWFPLPWEKQNKAKKPPNQSPKAQNVN